MLPEDGPLVHYIESWSFHQWFLSISRCLRIATYKQAEDLCHLHKIFSSRFVNYNPSCNIFYNFLYDSFHLEERPHLLLENCTLFWRLIHIAPEAIKFMGKGCLFSRMATYDWRITFTSCPSWTSCSANNPTGPDSSSSARWCRPSRTACSPSTTPPSTPPRRTSSPSGS